MNFTDDDVVEGEIIQGPTSDELLDAISQGLSVIFSVFLRGASWDIIVYVHQSSGQLPGQPGMAHDMPWALSGTISAVEPEMPGWTRFEANYHPAGEETKGSIRIADQ